ncbi:iron donor protein CyaY [Buchnera aphidicola (Neophyllaphis podocarpi)]|uniref:iron donor protein CyaY n=1 Tax=Buchnera aphidicola TaxID=9 RepID=UPI0031B874C5
MNNLEFYNITNSLMISVENKLDEYNNKIDIECEINNDVMYISFKNNSKIIINRQKFLKQVWLATQINGYHFNYLNKCWICNRTGLNFWKILEISCSSQSGYKIIF